MDFLLSFLVPLLFDSFILGTPELDRQRQVEQGRRAQLERLRQADRHVHLEAAAAILPHQQLPAFQVAPLDSCQRPVQAVKEGSDALGLKVRHADHGGCRRAIVLLNITEQGPECGRDGGQDQPVHP